MANQLSTRKGMFGIAIASAVILMYLYSISNIKLDPDDETSDSETPSHHDKWIVVTTVTSPTKDIKKLAAISGWKLLVVGDAKTPSDWSYPGCIYLGIKQQKKLGFNINNHMPYNSYTRKNIGYLYAIQHGARFIYDTDDDNHPAEPNGMLQFQVEPTTSGLIYEDTSKNLMNPYAHFGQPSIWPRGFPLNKVSQQNNNTYKLTNFITPSIQQGLVNGDPDVDAIYRLLNRKQNMTSLEVTFDHTAPPVALPRGVFAPFNSQNTMFHYNALWALLLPTSVAFRVTDIWRGYWAQRLMWLVGQKLAFLPPNAIQIRNSHNYISDFQDETQFYTQAGKLVDFLNAWNCNSTTFLDCVEKLSKDMMIAQFWSENDVNLVTAWLMDLKNIGYIMPKILNQLNKDLEVKDKLESAIFFTPSAMRGSQSERRIDLLTFCGSFFNLNTSNNFTKTLSQPSSYLFSNLLLVIVFNFPYHKNIKFFHTLYRDHFPNIVICSQTDSFEKMIEELNEGIPHWQSRPITFLNISSQGGYFGYECAIRAIEMNYQVDGFLIIGDDILLNPWSLASKNLNRVHFVYEGHVLFNRDLNTTSSVWWAGPMGISAIRKAFDEIEFLASTKQADLKLIKNSRQFIETRHKNNVNMTIVTYALADIYYVPRNKATMFLEMMKIFLKHGVFLEFAVPCVMAGLYESPINDHILKGTGYWGDDRNHIWTLFNATEDFLHPLKLSSLSTDVKSKQDYCDNYIYELINRW